MKWPPGIEAASYGRVAVALHWLIGLALLGQIGFGFMLDSLAPRGTPARGAVINLHKSCGLVLLALIVVRVGWRLTHAAPRWPASMSTAQQGAARLGHRALYACMLVQPVAGYIASNFSKHGVKFFGIVLKPWGADLPAVYAFFNGMHVVTAFVFTALIAGHVLIALKHTFIDHDGQFARIWPRNHSPETS
ncbi:MAG: cytochrome b [Bacteriovorax sp.]|nr:cytochrome b [Rhizobacter sp.]